MKNIVHRILVTALMISCIGTVDAAPTNEKNKHEKVVKTKPLKPAEQTKKGWSTKAKVIAALGVVATGIGLYFAWKKYTTTTQETAADKNLEILTTKKYGKREQDAQRYQIPGGRAGRLMHHVLANHEPCQEAMKNPVCQANIERLFNNAELIALMDNEHSGRICEAQLNAAFNDQGIVARSARPDFVEQTIAELNRRVEKIK